MSAASEAAPISKEEKALKAELNNSIACGNLALGLLATIAIGSSVHSDALRGIPFFASGVFTAAAVVHRHGKHKLSAQNYSDGFDTFAGEVLGAIEPCLSWAGKKVDPVIDRVIVEKLPPVAQNFLNAAAAEMDEAWIDEEMIRSSKLVVGVKGTGKSTWIRYEARRFLLENPDGIIRIVDLHHNEEEEWLPGIPADEYLATTPEKGLAFVREMLQTGLDRINSKSLNQRPYKLIIDEFQGLLFRLNDAEREEIAKAIETCEYEFRKYGVNITLTSKGIKQKNTGLDSSIVASMDLLALGRSIADSSTKWPDDLDRKSLLQRLSAVSALPGCKYACVYRKQGDDAEIKVIPSDLKERSDSITFDYGDPEIDPLEAWLTENRDRILSELQQGKSRTSIAKGIKDFGKRDNSNPKWMLLTELEKQVQAETIAPETGEGDAIERSESEVPMPVMF